MNAVWLIAGREFRAYVATTSFWVALLVGPALAAGALALGGGHPGAQPSAASLTLTPARDGGVEARFSDGFPLSDAARAGVLKTLAEDGRIKGPVCMAAPSPPPAIDTRALSRFALTLTLWMTLTGSLGMLLQAVVRERANRALESLLAAAGPARIVAGKLVGVGAVSALVASAWVAAGAAAASGAGGAGLRGVLLAAFADPLTLLGGLGLYVLAFAFYGLTTVAIGARARDNADAQNLARPMFAVLLAVFFAALAAAAGTRGLDGLVFVPPFTPFMLLMRPPGPAAQAAALALLTAATAAAGWLAVRASTLEAPRLWPSRPRRGRARPA